MDAGTGRRCDLGMHVRLVFVANYQCDVLAGKHYDLLWVAVASSPRPAARFSYARLRRQDVR